MLNKFLDACIQDLRTSTYLDSPCFDRISPDDGDESDKHIYGRLICLIFQIQKIFGSLNLKFNLKAKLCNSFDSKNFQFKLFGSPNLFEELI